VNVLKHIFTIAGELAIVSCTQTMSELENGSGEGNETYTPKCVLVTGGAGFIGSHVAKALVNTFPECKVKLWCMSALAIVAWRTTTKGILNDGVKCRKQNQPTL
jgi:hypothetical protein